MFVVGRDTKDGREFFHGVDGDNILTTQLIFNAMPFPDQGRAQEAAEFLAEHDLSGFAPSEIMDTGVSDNLA